MKASCCVCLISNTLLFPAYWVRFWDHILGGDSWCVGASNITLCLFYLLIYGIYIQYKICLYNYIWLHYKYFELYSKSIKCMSVLWSMCVCIVWVCVYDVPPWWVYLCVRAHIQEPHHRSSHHNASVTHMMAGRGDASPRGTPATPPPMSL